VLLHNASSDFFHWLQCADDPALAFVVVDAARLDVAYAPERLHRGLREAGIDCEEAPVLFVICTIHPPPAEPTANLLAPLAVCPRCLRGAQILLPDAGYGSREPLFARIAA